MGERLAKVVRGEFESLLTEAESAYVCQEKHKNKGKKREDERTDYPMADELFLLNTLSPTQALKDIVRTQ